MNIVSGFLAMICFLSLTAFFRGTDSGSNYLLVIHIISFSKQLETKGYDTNISNNFKINNL